MADLTPEQIKQAIEALKRLQEAAQEARKVLETLGGARGAR